MSITILKRARIEVSPATDPITYENWSTWSPTTDTSPFVDTNLIEYKFNESIDFKEEYLLNYASIMEAAIKDDTPFSKAVTFIEEEFEDSSITPAEKATIKGNMMVQMAIGTSNSAMQLGFTLTEKDNKFNKELQMMSDRLIESGIKKDIALASKAHRIKLVEVQKDSAVAAKDFTLNKNTQLTASVKFNNKIQAGRNLTDLYGQHRLAGGTLNSDMWTLAFTMVRDTWSGADTSLLTTNITVD